MLIDGVDALAYQPPRRAGQKTQRSLTFVASSDFQMQSAAAYAGVEWEDFLALPGNPEWIDPENPTTCKTHIIAWYLYRTKVDSLTHGG